ncbi:MAG: hypothetical protein KJ638_14525 [Chloroflexi bacterium]|nr:hypothetical protein [Chloroflexota bacterium]
MRKWNLKSGDPGAFTLAADVRCGPTDYTNDHIWELTLKGGEPPSLALQTTFGLRARNLRLFPRFVEGDTAVSDPSAFDKPPTVHRFYPNFLALSFSPFTGIDVEIEYWVPESQIVAGRVTITNSRLTPRNFRFEWAATLSPAEGGQRMADTKIEATTVLCGQTGGIFPVIFMTGGPEVSSGPYPALSVELDLAPGARRQFTWIHTALDTQEASFETARHTATRSWEAETARLDVLNASLIDIETGDPDWDAAFALAQKTALGLLIGPTEHLPHPSFVLHRQPDQGFSRRGDGSDYSHLWDGQTALDADFLASLILPAASRLAQGLLENFLENQKQQGFVDWKPGLGGQRGRMLATPILANLAWRIYQVTEDRSFLEEVFPKLLNFVHAWFTPQQDRDGDGLPEWAHPMQSGLEDHPAFSLHQPWSQGGDITKSESPSLCALLYNEIQILIRMARSTERTGPIPALEALADNLKSAIAASWNDSAAIYQNWDRDTHFSPRGEVLSEQQGNGELLLQRQFEQPVRLLIRIETSEEFARQVTVFIHGVGASETHRVERIPGDQFRWHIGMGSASSERVYSSIEHVEISGLADDDKVSIQVMDLSGQDHTLLLPLWAGVPDQDQAFELVKRTITDPEKFWRDFGVSACPLRSDIDNHPCRTIHIPWNNLIGEGLLAYGYRDEAAELVKRLMAAITLNLKQERAFYRNYQADTGSGIGERNALTGLAPLGLFMATLGVRLVSPTKILLSGRNPFPWTVTVRYRGLSIIREFRKTRIVFPGGQTAVVKSAEPQIVTLE